MAGLPERIEKDDRSEQQAQQGAHRRLMIAREQGLEEIRQSCDADHNARAMRDMLAGTPSPYRDIVVLTAAGALVVAGRAEDLGQGAALAAGSIDGGRAGEALDKMVEITNREAEGGVT